jgi:DNA polymerase I-like protein with 3'-5' exonuclease and polymerase domains
MAVLRSRFRDRKLKSQFLLQVHDSLVIDAYKEEVDEICELAVSTFKELPDLCKRYWGWNIDVPLTGDCEVGPTYGQTETYKKETN